MLENLRHKVDIFEEGTGHGPVHPVAGSNLERWCFKNGGGAGESGTGLSFSLQGESWHG